jgi:hypothetical protein
MDFVSADRTRDAEFKQELKNYNFGVEAQNRQITKDISDDRDREKKAEQDIDDAETFTQIKDAVGGSSALAHATATYDTIAKYRATANNVAKKVNQARQDLGETAERLQSNRPTTETPEVNESVEAPRGTDAVAKEGGLANEVEEESAGFLGKAGAKALKGVGGLGAVAGLGMAIVSDEHGGWNAKSTADKWGNGLQIGGSALDLFGLGLEATGFGVPLGLALQGLGTLATLGAGVESEISTATNVDPQKAQARADEKKEEKTEQAGIGTEAVGITQAQAGGLGVARQVQ